jgi:hypothetical protein
LSRAPQKAFPGSAKRSVPVKAPRQRRPRPVLEEGAEWSQGVALRHRSSQHPYPTPIRDRRRRGHAAPRRRIDPGALHRQL